MRILIVGASGTIGRAIVAGLTGRHDLVLASRREAPEQVDISDPASIGALYAAAISLVNAGLEGFARSAALDLPRGQRINVVSPPWLSETLRARGQDPSAGLPAADVARAYVASVEGKQTGTVLDPRASL